MPKLISLYIRSVFYGFGLSAVFVGLLFYFNIANLWQLISSSSMGWLAGVMLFMFNGIIFSGVQFGIAVMRLQDDDEPKGGKRDELVLKLQPAAITTGEKQPISKG